MKKSGVILSLLVISVLLVSMISSVGFVSAGLLGDIWSKITGRAVENETLICTDSDGRNYYVKGEFSGTWNGEFITNTDSCLDAPDETGDDVYSSQYLGEGYCENGILRVDRITCPNGCEDGVCMEQVPEEPEPEPEPTEPETCAASISINFNQDVYYEGDFFKVTIEVFDSQGNRIPNYPFYISAYLYSEDRWERESSDPEYTNEQGYVEHSDSTLRIVETVKLLYKVYTEETSSCNSVEDTAEIEFIAGETTEAEPGQEPIPRISPTEEPEPEIPPEKCAAKIVITFDKEVYYYGDEFEVLMEVFDSQGNPIPNYPFYIQMYDYDGGKWHTFEDDRTDENGYRIHKEIIDEDEPIQFGENRFKIYTEAYTNCASVEGITKIEIRRRERPESVPCGIGTCIPEEEEEVEAIPEDRIFYKCNGCELDDKCYPMGYRKEGKYCSDNNEFIDQSKVGTCDNHFECESNVCISGECVGEGLIKKIINFFKRIFGIKPEPEEPGDKICKKLLIEKNIGDYEYVESAYGHKDHQVALYSEDGKQIGIVKCCIAAYENPDGTEGAGIVCPFDNREDVENSLYWLSDKEEIILGEYKGQKVYEGGEPEPEVIVWTSNAYIVASGGGPEEGQFPEEIADAYLKKYKNDLEEIEIPEPEPGPEICSDLIIKRDLGGYEHIETIYGERGEPGHGPIFSDDGEQIGTVKCCVAQYKNPTGQEQGASICLYDNKHDVENLVKFALEQTIDISFVLEEYNGEKVYKAKDPSTNILMVMVWTYDTYVVAVFGDEKNKLSPSEEFADAYISKFPSDIGFPEPLPPVECSELLIEQDFGENKYIQTWYGEDPTGLPLFSDDGEKLGTVKCCQAQYKDSTGQEHGGVVCPYDNRHDVENLIEFFGSDAPPDEPGGPYNSLDLLSEYKGEIVLGEDILMIWTHDNYVLIVGGDERKRIPFPRDMADAYLDKYPSDLGEIIG